MKASRVSRMKVRRTPGRLLRRLYCVRFLEDTNGKIKKANVAWRMGRAHEGRSAADCRARSRSPAISHKTWQAENPDVLLGRTRYTSACHCSSPSGLTTNCGVPFITLPESLTSFTVYLRAHMPAFQSHFLTANNIGTVFLNFFFESHFLLSHCTQIHAPNFSIFFFESHFLLSLPLWNRLKSQVSCPRWWWWWVQALHFPCSLCLTKHLQLRPNPREIGKMILQHCWWICLRKSFLPIAWTAWHSSSGKKFYWGLRRHFHGPLCTLGLKFSQSTQNAEEI